MSGIVFLFWVAIVSIFTGLATHFEAATCVFIGIAITLAGVVARGLLNVMFRRLS